MRLGDATWTDVAGVTTRSADGTLAPVLLIPVGSTEQHGPHLPMNTDTLVAEELAARALHHTDGLLVGPTVSVTASGEHQGFPGTLSIGTATTTAVLVELVRSADWAAAVVLVWFTCGGLVDLRRMFRRLRELERDADDDGIVRDA